MTTRHGKIARLPNDVREELNQRLFNGAMGPELLAWLNQLLAVKEVLSRFFAGAPVNKQNLSDWRHGGYQDWLRHQERELRIQRLSEEGVSLKQQEGKEDLFENFARIAVAELTVDMDSLDKMDGEQRWNRLRGLTRELARLQNGYNRSRWTELFWTKWNDRFVESSESPSDEPESADGQEEDGEDQRAAGILLAAEQDENDDVGSENDENPTSDESERQAQPQPSNEPKPVKVDHGVSKGEELDQPLCVTRIIYHRKCCWCVCSNCHPKEGEYTYADAVRDMTEVRQRGSVGLLKGSLCTYINPTDCNCVCEGCKK
jgi:hypothetical protein